MKARSLWIQILNNIIHKIIKVTRPNFFYLTFNFIK